MQELRKFKFFAGLLNTVLIQVMPQKNVRGSQQPRTFKT